MTDLYRALVLSDLHAVNDPEDKRDGPALNYARGSAPRGLVNLCLGAVQKHYPDGVDVLLVAGDLTDRASSGALQSVWNDLHWLAAELGVPLVATAGNHDFDSRGKETPLPHSSLYSLEPPFPFDDDSARDKYFAAHHAVYRDDRAVIVTANSAGHHGFVADDVLDGGKPRVLERDHGRFTSQFPDWLLKSLDKARPLPGVRIFLTHHHMNQLPDFDDEERSSSIGHEAVLRSLAERGDWLIIHGHKHRGWIQYASGSGDAPPLLSASSFSANLGTDSFADKVRHQFHVIELPSAGAEVAEGITGSHGRVRSWTYSPLGWEPASEADDLPGVSGFGWKTSVAQLAIRIRAHLALEPFLSRDELLALEPRIAFLTFDDQRRLVERLKTGSPAVRVSLTSIGEIEEISSERETAA